MDQPAAVVTAERGPASSARPAAPRGPLVAAPLPAPARPQRGAAHALRTGARLPLRRWATLAEASVLVVAARGALAVWPYATVRRAFARLPVGRPTPDLGRARDAAWAVDAAGRRLLGRRPCLPQALVGQWMLRRAGVETDLKLGVARDAAGVRAHAWLEHAGRVVVGGRGSAALYVPLEPTAPPAL